MEYREKDVFRYRFNDDYLKKHEYAYHCFDGKLIVKKKEDGTLYFTDTYWNYDKHKFNFDELEKNGTLTFICNLDDVVECSQTDYRYYNEDDIFDLSYQHGCYKRFVRKKDAKRSKEVMLDYIKNTIEEKERKLRWLQDEISYLNEKCELINMEDFDLEKIYL